MYSTNTVEGNARRCKRCGKAIAWKEGKQGRPPSYCSAECRRLWRQEHPSPQGVYAPLKHQVRQCVICGKEFTPRWRTQKCCSKACGRKSEAETKRKHRPVCKFCGKAYIPKKPDRLTYCSRECAHAAQKARAAARAEAEEKARRRVCVICGKVFRGQLNSKYCSDECRKEKKRRDARQHAESKHKSTRKTVTCKECGKQFVPEYGTKRRRFCSEFCLHKYTHRVGKAVRRARIKGCSYEVFDPIEIFERDKWRCQLCGRKTPKSLRGTTDDRAPELDHIVPLALGGAHTRANVQCVCRRCNQTKGANVQGQLRLM